VDWRVVPAGSSNFSIQIAGQVGFTAAWDPLSTSTDVPFGRFVLGCKAGSYAHVGETCRPCPAQYPNDVSLTGASCAGYLVKGALPFVQRFPYPRPLKGWYNLNSSDLNTAKWGSGDAGADNQMLACPDGFQDAGRDVCIVPCDPPESCTGDNRCAYGYASKPPMWRCASCDAGASTTRAPT
jgi:hypothetical protein